MKCAIFCLVAFCAFQTIFADCVDDAKKFEDKLKQNLDKQHKKTVAQINNNVKIIQDKITAAVNAAEKKGIKTGLGTLDDGCLGSFLVSMKTCVDPKISQLDECINQALTNKDNQVGKKCFQETVAAFKKEAKLQAASAKRCISNCAHQNCTEDE